VIRSSRILIVLSYYVIYESYDMLSRFFYPDIHIYFSFVIQDVMEYEFQNCRVTPTRCFITFLKLLRRFASYYTMARYDFAN